MGEHRHQRFGGIKLWAAGAAVAGAAAVVVAGGGLIGTAPARAGSIGPAVRSSPMAYIGSDGKIAFVRNGNIFTIRPDGTGLTKLTNLGGASGPRWSPNGTELAFVFRGNLWIMKANGSKKTRITDAAPRDTDGRPTWSPNGRYLAFVKTFRRGSFGYLTRYDTVTRRLVTFTDKIATPHEIKVAALSGSAVAWQWALNATGQAFGSFLLYEGAGRQCLHKRFCLDALGFGRQDQYRNGFPSAESVHSTPTRLTDPDWLPIRPHFATDVLTTVEDCAVLPCAHRGLKLMITAATILPGGYEGVYSPLGDRIAFVRNARGKARNYTLKVSPAAMFSPVFLTGGTEPDWQPTLPLPPA